MGISLGGLLIGVLNILILALVLVLIGAICEWVLSALGWPVPMNVRRIYIAIVALIVLVAFVSLLLGAPLFHVIGARVSTVGFGGSLPWLA